MAEENGEKRADYISKEHPILESCDKEKTIEFKAMQILKLLSMNRYRRGPIKYIEENEDIFLNKIKDAIRNDRPIELILVLFAFKILNPLKTWAEDGSEVDISEVASILRFYEISQAITHLYPNGAKFKISCDGRKYYDPIGMKEEAGIKYYKNVKSISEYLEVDSHVQLFDEVNFYPNDYKNIEESNLKKVLDVFKKGQDIDFISFVTKLKCSLALIIPIDKSISLETLALAFSTGVSDEDLFGFNPEAYDLRMWVKEESTIRTLKYIACYNTVKELNIIENISPNALRATVHPKPGQFGLYSVNKSVDNVFPHHAQGTSNEQPHLDSLRLKFRADIMRNNKDNQITGIILDPKKYPFSNGKHPFTFIRS